MTTGNFERGPKELPKDQFRIEDISPETIYGLKHIPLGANFIILGSPAEGYSFVELTTDVEVREALKDYGDD